MSNVSEIIKQHNKNVSNKKVKQTNPCNCRNKNECPLNGNCKVQNAIYKCTVSVTQIFKRRGYWNISKRCLLCLHEKLLILNYQNPAELLNKRSKLMLKCCHENKFLLSNYKGND